jgi:hypothetical protein
MERVSFIYNKYGQILFHLEYKGETSLLIRYIN